MFTTIPPKGEYLKFTDENEYMHKTKSWGLLSASARAPKKEFMYKRENTTYTVTIKGYETDGTHETAVVSFSNEALHCVHPAYLKEMQSASFGKESVLNSQEATSSGELPEAGEPAQDKQLKKKKKEPKEKTSKAVLELPGEKVSFEAVVKEFATKYNHFNESEDEILILEHVKITGENPLEVGEAWCGYSNTLKKQELAIGNSITFDAKIVDKKFNKDIRYKINNPSKIAKQS
ncbi:hypothetical protein ELQ35_14835 [Peribacillus cavernae]|uniref:Uncharacterized protein n=1 Tax=Peribacillus cavernae TaxID=1674310 RepID=A0A3S0VH02_9BACI|nr:hypothetical protein [Peribacillus cavernae]MDQ0219311.1 hypothetical protein [Peribacillus cavernae]RUQ27804.1 hypothetical protein ELQ35_14835 [Peribacillus cavernae]